MTISYGRLSYGVFSKKQAQGIGFSGLLVWQGEFPAHRLVWLGFGDTAQLLAECRSDFCRKNKIEQLELAEDQSSADKIWAALYPYWQKGEAANRMVNFLYGTEFQKRVWQELLKIPKGQTCSYQSLAKNIGRPKAVRAVGAAVGANPISLFVPCHRVVKANGEIHNYRWGKDIKQQLLREEKL